jgi:hypothetical protein
MTWALMVTWYALSSVPFEAHRFATEQQCVVAKVDKTGLLIGAGHLDIEFQLRCEKRS